MNKETKQILIDLIDYYNMMGTESDPGIHTFEHIVQRASKALKREASKGKAKTNKNSGDVDPYAIDVVGG